MTRYKCPNDVYERINQRDRNRITEFILMLFGIGTIVLIIFLTILGALQ